ncbi:hypothetical protein BRADI_1g13986v3, partial [Brachypodium distachyon]
PAPWPWPAQHKPDQTRPAHSPRHRAQVAAPPSHAFASRRRLAPRERETKPRRHRLWARMASPAPPPAAACSCTSPPTITPAWRLLHHPHRHRREGTGPAAPTPPLPRLRLFPQRHLAGGGAWGIFFPPTGAGAASRPPPPRPAKAGAGVRASAARMAPGGRPRGVPGAVGDGARQRARGGGGKTPRPRHDGRRGMGVERQGGGEGGHREEEGGEEADAGGEDGADRNRLRRALVYFKELDG